MSHRIDYSGLIGYGEYRPNTPMMQDIAELLWDSRESEGEKRYPSHIPSSLLSLRQRSIPVIDCIVAAKETDGV